MESLVVEEVEKQLQKLPAKVSSYVNKAEVIAYALNRLPALYATSEKGWEQQVIRARRELGNQILAAVRQAIAAVQRDPLRAVVPLKIGAEQESQVVLQELKELLGQEELSWRNVVDGVENALIRTARGEVTWRKRGNAAAQRNEWHDSRYYL
ncbi:competence protein ComFB [Stenomitos frigidus ULC18]|uniref:Competence protein ComFB n=2 Tax=Stenomitos TaxID=1844270 RepID=A0A2T1DZH7_9CYAN|nr:competence protein ComFB [Stenomitos frigidus ULC18]